ELGVTRVELGVQSLSDAVYDKVNRGHTVDDVVRSTKTLKDAGLKVGYHLMPGLFSDIEADLEMFRKVFEDPRFRPDSLKIYPTLVMEGTGLYDMWNRGEFEPYSVEEALKVICKVKKIMPKWVRTMRIQRDIPAQLIAAGVKKGDLGDLVYRRLREEGVRCRCIRCRDAGHLTYREGIDVGKVEILKAEYEASDGVEYFISAEDVENDALVGYIRLRLPSNSAHRKEISTETALVRELKVLGQALRLGERSAETGQHEGFGELLLKEAEELSMEQSMEKILITSAIGTRDYYRKFNYERIGPYMGKRLN
ncbi:MAG: tRNA uridine(34) 5-carboxymethylaminomethyl modification radical SAM/GNAT enzyme Elp3, partial [Candidatus Hydrothermarchaeales archaeon]